MWARVRLATSESSAASSTVVLTIRQPIRPSGLIKSLTRPSKYARTSASDAPGRSSAPSFWGTIRLA